MTGYLLNTSTLSYLVDEGMPQHLPVSARFSAESRKVAIGVSILTVYEVSLVVDSAPPIAAALRFLQDEFDVAPLPLDGVATFLQLKRGLSARRGVALKALAKDNVDLMIAATALALDLVLVSNDAIFADLAAIEPRLTVEDWTT